MSDQAALEANKAVVKRFIQALGGADEAGLRATVANDIQAVCTGTSLMSMTRGYDEVIGAAAMLKQITKNGIEMKILNLTAEADRVAAEFEGKSTLVTGQAYNNQYHMLFFLRDGRIVRMHEYMDSLLVEKLFAQFVKPAA